VHFKGLNLSPFGAAFKITFSTERAAKQIRWEQSKRLLQGSLVALSPASDMFEKVCKIAVVAARPIAEGLDQNPPMIDLYWGDPSDAVFDPVERMYSSTLDIWAAILTTQQHMLCLNPAKDTLRHTGMFLWGCRSFVLSSK
jgi:hypothetical protein